MSCTTMPEMVQARMDRVFEWLQDLHTFLEAIGIVLPDFQTLGDWVLLIIVVYFVASTMLRVIVVVKRVLRWSGRWVVRIVTGVNVETSEKSADLH